MMNHYKNASKKHTSSSAHTVQEEAYEHKPAAHNTHNESHTEKEDSHTESHSPCGCGCGSKMKY